MNHIRRFNDRLHEFLDPRALFRVLKIRRRRVEVEDFAIDMAPVKLHGVIANRMRGWVLRVNETLGMTETVNKARTMARSLAETVGISEGVAKARSIVRTLAEIAGVNETSPYARGFVKVVDETIGIVEGIFDYLVEIATNAGKILFKVRTRLAVSFGVETKPSVEMKVRTKRPNQ